MKTQIFSKPQCKDCKFVRVLKHNWLHEHGYEISYCCVLWEHVKEPGYTVDINSYVMEVDLFGSGCEMFTPKDDDYKWN